MALCLMPLLHYFVKTISHYYYITLCLCLFSSGDTCTFDDDTVTQPLLPYFCVYSHQEIVVLDDGTVSQAIRKHAMEFLQDPQYSKVKVYRSEDSMGPASSRFKAAAVAKSPVIVFVSSSVVVNVGWIEPLIDAVR